MAEQLGKTTTRVNLRSGPGTGNTVEGILDPGTPLTVLGANGDWLRVDIAGRQGFLLGKFVALEMQAVPAGLAGGGSGDPFPDLPMAPATDQLIQLAAG